MASNLTMSATSISQIPQPPTKEKSEDAVYWWLTSGRDLDRMMQEAGYPDEVQRQFLAYYRDTICPQLGQRPSGSSVKSGLGWDGSPFEYSFELKSSTASESVRFGADFANLSPPDDDEAGPGPLDLSRAEKVINSFAGKTPGFDDTWYRSLVRFYDQSGNPKNKQLELVSKAGHQTPIVVGFDLFPRISSDPTTLPVMGKVYFPPCHLAAAKGLSRWDAIYQSIQQLPDVSSFPRVLKSLDMIGEYLASKPAQWKDGARYLATDFVVPEKARLKIYLRYPGESFDEIWDYYTLGGRIPTMDGDKAMFRDLIALTGQGSDGVNTSSSVSHSDFTDFRRKKTCIYFSLSPDNETPASKIGIYPANFAPNDGVIARGLDSWLRKYNWPVSKSIEDQMRSVL